MATGQTSAQMALRDPDIRLMLRVRGDDGAAFAELVERFQHRLVAVMHHLVGSAEEAEDLAQEVFLRVYRTRKRYTPRAKFSTWLFTIANNLALNALRNRKRRPVMPLEVQDSGPVGTRPAGAFVPTRDEPPNHNLQQQELAGVIRDALEGLNERQRMAIVLNKFEDMNYADIADVMGLTTKAVKSLLSRARGKLREALQGYIYMDGAVPPGVGDDDENTEP
ncbi:sigma-70 family RNA polymerase sigma factor [Gemmata sp. JC717]|uniref:RNA polymerase sigma factor n=1 Tax=Gemmata algarum TaxID=2975278 RepID=A0ABU5EQL4_9BACT|nr:sigma-70 family RNA polymerase sigma factor [Gemmata algarum]MDY3553723.1 sigma-70 family RNA polymerase sigma factor [Gemmata algarum]MDY3557646.1 sigma-70 family RNA polymerase sigma factor [Gemmata algarum]